MMGILANSHLKMSTDISCLGAPLSPLVLPLLDCLETQGAKRAMVQLEFQTFQYVFGASMIHEKPDINLNFILNRINWTIDEAENLLRS